MKSRALLVLSVTPPIHFGKIEWRDGKVDAIGVHPSLKESAKRWAEDGLDELVRSDGDVEKRFTPASDPEFLDRLADYIERQTGLTTMLITTDQVSLRTYCRIIASAPTARSTVRPLFLSGDSRPRRKPTTAFTAPVRETRVILPVFMESGTT